MMRSSNDRRLACFIVSAVITFLAPRLGHSQDGQRLAIIPAPQQITIREGHFSWADFGAYADPETKIFPEGYQWIYTKLQERGIGSLHGDSFLHLHLDSSLVNPEAYTLEITPQLIDIRAGSRQGLMHGMTTLLQTITTDSMTGQLYSPCLVILDQPRFPYRGMHLDVCRHFFPVDFIKRYIDYLAFYKFNTFHWHLTEDQGWRIEIKRYPKLTDTGAWRSETLVGHYREQPHRFDGQRYGGYYTQEEIRDVVAYARDRGITIIPEIEMPGHALAALSAYPELSCTGGPFEPATKWGVFEDVYCTKEETIIFLQHVLDEVIDLFPGPYIHVGGDECPKTRWAECPECQETIRSNGLANEHELQSWFIHRIERYLNAKGRRLIGWDEILEGGLAPEATVMSWRGVQGGLEAASQSHDVIMTPGKPCYFDHYQSTQEGQPLAIGGYNPLSDVYAWDPIPPSLDPAFTQYILGGQANVWTEYMPDEQQVEYMIFPRMAAMAETLWSPPTNRDYPDFLDRLDVHTRIWDQWGVRYFASYRQEPFPPAK